MKKNIIPFGNNQVKLRLIEHNDLSMTLNWRNDNDVRCWFKSSQIIPLENHLNWFKNYLLKENDLLFIVESNGIPVGQAAVYNIDMIDRKAEIGRFIVSKSESGKGHIFHACKEIINFCKKDLNLNYLYLEVYERNLRARKLYLSLGFENEIQDGELIRMGLIL